MTEIADPPDFPKVSADDIRALVEDFLGAEVKAAAVGGRHVRQPITATGLGKIANSDPTLVFDLRNGRELRRATIDKVVEAIEEFRPGFASEFLEKKKKAAA